MILPVHDLVRSRLRLALTEAFGLTTVDQPSIVIEMPPNRALGDLAVPVAFELARRLRKAPRLIAQELAAVLGHVDGVTRIEAAPNGYLNLFLSRATFLQARLSDQIALLPPAETGKVIVEHTAINPNKAAHIGHLRNATLGDTLVRLLRFQGREVEVQNYVDDTGVQVADVVAGFHDIERKTLAEVRAIADSTRFDYYCWDLYARVTDWYGADKAHLQARADALHAIEHGGNEIADLGAFIADRIVRCHLKTMARMNVDYDLLSWEGDILRLQFWATAFEDLKARGAVFLQTEGKLAGCWVMTIEEAASGSDEAARAADGNAAVEGDSGHDEATSGSDEVARAADGNPAAKAADGNVQREKVIVRSNGTVTYVGKDIANQFWKFGLLGKDFYYRVFEPRDGHPIWATSSTPATDGPAPPSFGRARAVYNVIDSRQAYLQVLLKQALATLGFQREADHSVHFSYDMVALTHNTARQLGYDAADSAGKPFVEVSGRKGLGVKADDLLDRLIETARGEVAGRNAELAPEECRRIAEDIATAAVRYFLIKFSRGKVIAFDIDEALSFEGETGPYIQYAVVRANNIFAKLRERDHVDDTHVIAAVRTAARDALEDGIEGDALWGLVLEAARLDEFVESSVRSLELSVLAKYAFGLAQSFNAFYHQQPILRETRADARMWRGAAVLYVRRQLTRALDLMGCRVPVKM